ncbi:MFS transporter (plasmid) [Mycolicibacterium vanbaalenii]|uniref:MFS transporter n=1 Tax=Mycolicibacterium vanbaalenii TaxID=110539 RepID=UPI001F447E14|nr:MFS transporter [Mycolicibacterium vanbaalenii]UJL32161.1 MFS transporter [Mycolicibacterium vanbaalenii]WND60035.1 MFS transporter [Mycolicibacterium vanbaalenii]
MARRLDESNWRPMHTRIAAALGIGWMLDAFEVQIIGSVIPGIQAEFNLDGWQAVLINIVWFVGIAFGALGFGYLADRVGRRRLFVATLILYSLAAIATATAPSYEIFVLFRFITALGVGGEYSAVTSAIAEFTPARTRGRSNGVVMSFWAVGGILASLVSILVISTFGLSWRYTMLFGVISAGYGVIARRLIPESPRWLAAQGRLDEADRVVTAITGIKSADGYILAGPPRGTRSALGELWANHRPKLFFGMALDFSEAAGYYGLFTAMSIYVFSSATGAVPISDSALPYYFLTANIGAFFGGLLVSWALDAAGRRPTVTISYTAAAASMLGCAAAAATGSKTLVLVAFTVAAFFATCAWVSAYPTFSEIFPTALRATGIGASVGVGRMGAVVGQILLAEVAEFFNLTTVFVVLGLFWLIGAAAGALWWLKGVEARGVSVDALGARTADINAGLAK